MIDQQLLDILACPATQKGLRLATEQELKTINQAVEAKTLRNKAQVVVDRKLDAALFREDDNNYVYPVYDNIPVLLVEELIGLEDLLA